MKDLLEIIETPSKSAIRRKAKLQKRLRKLVIDEEQRRSAAKKIRGRLKTCFSNVTLPRQGFRTTQLPLILTCNANGHGKFLYTHRSLMQNDRQPCKDCRKEAEDETQTTIPGYPMYHRFRGKLTIEEAPESDKQGYLTTVCKKCGRRFHPTSTSAFARVYALEGRDNVKGERHLYCSRQCKERCEIYGKNPMIHGDYRLRYSDNDIPPETRQAIKNAVKRRDDHTCVKCGTREFLEVHHVTPKAVDPFYVNDMDNLITLCYDCHKQAHEGSGCTYSDLAKQAAERQTTLEDLF